jgi:hypothetical protein
MYFNSPSYNSSSQNYFSKPKTFKGGVMLATVIEVKPISLNSYDFNKDELPSIDKMTKTFNVDSHIIKCFVRGVDSDDMLSRPYLLPNSIPLLPRNNNRIPKKGQQVLVFLSGFDDSKFADRYYIGPITATELDLNATLFGGSNATQKTSFIDIPEDIAKLPNAKGVYVEYDKDYDYALKGNQNADIVFKNSEVLIRGGKFVPSKPEEFNQTNPSYIQIKHGFNYNQREISVNNVVANKINLITYDGLKQLENNNISVTKRDLKTNTTPYIDDVELNKILEQAHPLVHGDVLLEYLALLELAFLTHNHNDFGLTPPIMKNPNIESFVREREKLRKKMLSQNIKII